MAGRAAARAAQAASPEELSSAMEAYAAVIENSLQREMISGQHFLEAFTRHPLAFHLAVAFIPKVWSVFVGVLSGETTFASLEEHRLVRLVLPFLCRVPVADQRTLTDF